MLWNDYDPDGHTPLTPHSVFYGGDKGEALVSGNSVFFSPHGLTGDAVVSYTVRDSLGAMSSSTLTIDITEGFCGGGGGSSLSAQPSTGSGDLQSEPQP